MSYRSYSPGSWARSSPNQHIKETSWQEAARRIHRYQNHGRTLSQEGKSTKSPNRNQNREKYESHVLTPTLTRIGGMTAAALTAPLDVLKTRLQSDFYQAQIQAARAANPVATHSMNPLRQVAHHFKETGQILASVYRQEGPRALFKGLGPNLVGVVPARSITFFTYGNSKRLITEHLNHGQDAAWVHLSAGVTAGIVTSTATNPIWMVKTRLQLDKNVVEESGGAARRRYKNSYDCVRQILRTEGIQGLYKGMSASYLGVAESTLQWMLYEQMKRSLALREERIIASGRDKTWWDHTVDWTGKVGAAGGAKFVAAVLAYPHEV